MRWFAAPVVLLVLGGAALAWDASGTLPASVGRCAGEADEVQADFHAPAGVPWVEVSFFFENTSNETIRHAPPAHTVRAYEARALGRLALLHENESPSLFEPGFDGFEVPPGERAWLGGILFEPPAGASGADSFVAVWEGEGRCGSVAFTLAEARTP